MKKYVSLLLLLILLISCQLNIDERVEVDFDLSDVIAVNSAGTREDFDPFENINRVILCIIKDGQHIFRNHSIDIEKKNGRIITQKIKLKKGDMEIGCLILVNDTDNISFLVKPEDKSKIRIKVEGDTSIILKNDLKVTQTCVCTCHTCTDTVSCIDGNHISHTCEGNCPCDGKAWCDYPDTPVDPSDDPVVDPTTDRTFWTEVRGVNHSGTPLFPRISANFSVETDSTLLDQSTIPASIDKITLPGDYSTYYVTFSKDTYFSEVIILQNGFESTVLLTSGYLHNLDAYTQNGLPIVVTLDTSIESVAKLEIASLDMPQNSGSFFLQNILQSGEVTDDLSPVIGMTNSTTSLFSSVGVNEYFVISDIDCVINETVKLVFKSESDEFVGHLLLQPGAENAITTANYDTQYSLYTLTFTSFSMISKDSTSDENYVRFINTGTDVLGLPSGWF